MNEEPQMHINSLELLTASFALQSFMKSRIGIIVLLRLDNTSAVAYNYNNLGGTFSPWLVALAKEL